MMWFLFIGDMVVMLFMVLLVIWVSLMGSDKRINVAAKIPLQDEKFDD